MSGWEWFTWLNTGILGLGSVIVFALFLRQLPALLPRRRPPAEGEAVDTGAHND